MGFMTSVLLFFFNFLKILIYVTVLGPRCDMGDLCYSVWVLSSLGWRA